MDRHAYPQKSYDLVQKKLMDLLNGEGIQFAGVFVCPHGSREACICRKPKTGLVDEFIRKNNVDLTRSYVFGDRETDVQFAKNIGCRSVRLTSDTSTKSDFRTESFLEACNIHSTTGSIRGG